MADITQVKRMLNERVSAVAAMLLPDGKRDGVLWRVGSVEGEPGQSLKVNLDGSHVGDWYDFATGDHGDLLDLWSHARKVSLSDALADAKRYLGVSDPLPYREPKKTYRQPRKPRCSAPRGKALEYLASRGIPEAVLSSYKVAADGEAIFFPFLRPDGSLALVKTREAVPGAHPRPTEAECEPILFGWQAIPANARELVIAEGEIDALSLAAYGLPAVSVPFGGGKGGKQQWIEHDFERLERFERIYLATDMDKPGDEAAEEISSRLGRHRCLRVKLPKKDANECLQAGVTKEEMQRLFAEAESLDPEGLRRPSDFAEDVQNIFWPVDGRLLGYPLPYDRLAGKVAFRPAEMTLWTGATGVGKSLILSDCIPEWIHRGSRICLASFEMKCAQTLKRMVKQAGGVDRPAEEYILQVLRWLDGGLLLYERVGKAGVTELLTIFDYARAKYGCDQFVIDSLMRLGIAQDDYSGQERVAFRLVDWAIEHNVHVHLVAHARKGGQDRGIPESEDVKGAMEIGANAANILTVWRNRKQEQSVHDAQEWLDRATTDEERAAAARELEVAKGRPSVVLNVSKQRNGDFQGKTGLWFNQETYQYGTSADFRSWNRSYAD